MAIEDIENKNGDPAEPDKPAEDPVAKRLEALEKQNKELAEIAKASQTDAQASKNYVGSLIQQIQNLAAQQKMENDKRDGGKTLRELYEEDPLNATNELFNQRVGPIINEHLDNQGRQNREFAKEKLKDKFTKYEKEIDEFMDSMPLDVRAKPGSYEAAYRQVLAQHIDEEVEERTKAAIERASQPEGASPPASRTPAKPVLDPIEMTVMKELGLSEDEWVKYRHTETSQEK